jgi:outer membrane protein OmpA-like peptidoglycan-associated protein
LELNGLDQDRIEYEYQGEKKPADTNKTSEGKKRNRRVDFQFI